MQALINYFISSLFPVNHLVRVKFPFQFLYLCLVSFNLNMVMPLIFVGQVNYKVCDLKMVGDKHSLFFFPFVFLSFKHNNFKDTF